MNVGVKLTLHPRAVFSIVSKTELFFINWPDFLGIFFPALSTIFQAPKLSMH